MAVEITSGVVIQHRFYYFAVYLLRLVIFQLPKSTLQILSNLFSFYIYHSEVTSNIHTCQIARIMPKLHNKHRSLIKKRNQTKR